MSKQKRDDIKKSPVRQNAPVYEASRKNTLSRGEQLIKALPSMRDVLIYKEIFDKPLAMRTNADERL